MQSLLNYASDKYFKLPSLAQVVPLSLPPANCPIIVTNPAEEFTFKTAILNSIVHGRYVVCV